MLLSLPILAMFLATCTAKCADCDAVNRLREVDPAPLKPYWWADPSFYTISDEMVRNLSMALTDEKYCSNPRHTYWLMEKHTGGTNNFLFEFSRFLVFLGFGPSAPGRSMHVPILPAAFEGFIGHNTLDWKSACRSWICLLEKAPPKARKGVHQHPLAVLNGMNVFHYPDPPGIRHGWVSTIITQLFTRPMAPFRQTIEDFEQQVLVDNSTRRFLYLGLHLRHLDNSCLARVRAGGYKDAIIKAEMGRKMTPSDMCTMSTPFIQSYINNFVKVFESSGVTAKDVKIYVAHDGQQKQELRRISRDFQGRVFTAPSYLRGPEAVIFDMTILIRSSFFVGNAASSLSSNVAAVRKVLLGEQGYAKYSNI
jgi:hypothetical protein